MGTTLVYLLTFWLCSSLHDPKCGLRDGDQSVPAILWRQRQEQPRMGPPQHGRRLKPLCSVCGDHLSSDEQGPSGLVQCIDCLNYFHCKCHKPEVVASHGVLVRGTWTCRDCGPQFYPKEPLKPLGALSWQPLPQAPPPANRIVPTFRKSRVAESSTRSKRTLDEVGPAPWPITGHEEYDPDLEKALQRSRQTFLAENPDKLEELENDDLQQAIRASLGDMPGPSEGVKAKKRKLEDEWVTEEEESEKDEQPEDISNELIFTDEMDPEVGLPDFDSDEEERMNKSEDEFSGLQHSRKWKGKLPVRDGLNDDNEKEGDIGDIKN